MATRAFAGDPQPVEVHHRGIWYSGELLGWRHTSDGRVSARVRCTVDGLRHSTWKDLAELRLPDPAHPPRREPFPAAPARPLPGPPVEDEDRTRPNNVFATLSTRPAKPAHAGTPPLPPGAPAAVPAPPAPPAPAPSAPPAPVLAAAPAAPARQRPTPYRRSGPPRQSDPWSRGWADARPHDEADDRLSTV